MNALLQPPESVVQCSSTSEDGSPLELHVQRVPVQETRRIRDVPKLIRHIGLTKWPTRRSTQAASDTRGTFDVLD